MLKMRTRSQTRARSTESDGSSISYLPTRDEDESDNATYSDEEVGCCNKCNVILSPDDVYVFDPENCLYCETCAKVKPDTRKLNSRASEKSSKNLPEDTQTNRSYNEFFSSTVIFSLVLFAAIACFVYFVNPSSYLIFLSLQDENTPEKIDCKNGSFVFEYLKKNFIKKFPKQKDMTWFTFGSGIMRIFTTNPTEPSSFLLYHNDHVTANCLVKDISKFASNCLTGTYDVIDVSGKELKEEVSDDSGELITRYKDKILEKNVMVVRNLNDLPGSVVKEFHYFTDTYTPLVHKAVYFFTFSTDEEISGGQGISDKVHKSFKKLWNDTLGNHVLDPLIARMTTNIIPVITEESFKYNC